MMTETWGQELVDQNSRAQLQVWFQQNRAAPAAAKAEELWYYCWSVLFSSSVGFLTLEYPSGIF